MRVSKSFLLFFLVWLFILPFVVHVRISASGTVFSDDFSTIQNPSIGQESAASASSKRIDVNPPRDESVQKNSRRTFQEGLSILQLSSSSSFIGSIDHVMCKNCTSDGIPINPTTIFSPGDTEAVCLIRTPINGSADFRWYYRSDTSRVWIFCGESTMFVMSNDYSKKACAGQLFIADHELYYPRAYEVDFYLNGRFSFSDFFEITNGGLESPRTCEGVDANGYPINAKSRFTIGVDANVYCSLRFDKVAYFNDELGCSHNITTVWVQPDGTVYETYSASFADYKDMDINLNYWEYRYAANDYITISSSTPVGNWKVEVYLDGYYLNGTWTLFGPVATAPFVVENNKTAADWTFMVYLDADYPGGNQPNDSAGINTFLDISKVGSSSQVNTVVQMDRIAGWLNGSGVWTEDTRFGNWTDCKRFHVTTNMTPTAENAIADLGEVDMGDPETLRDFVNWTMNCYPADRYCLVLWDHGAGFEGLCMDWTNQDYLSMPKLNQALDGLPAIIDVLINDACGMSMIEVAYQIKDYANIMVGPEGLGYSPGAYNWYLEALASNPSMTASELATEVVNDYITWCDQVRLDYSKQGLPQLIQNATLSAIDLTRVTSLSAAVDDFALELKNKETPYDEKICSARNQTEEYPGPYNGDTGCYADLYDFARLLNTSTFPNTLDEELQNTAGRVMTAINQSMIIAENILLPNSHGLAIFLPIDKADYSRFENEYENTNFAADTSWNEFLQYHLSGCLLTIQTIPAWPGISLIVTNESYIPVIAASVERPTEQVTDNYGKAQVFLVPAYYSVNVTADTSTGPGSRLAFIQWEDKETSNSRTLFVNGTTTLTAEYQPQYQLIISANLGTTTPPVGSEWCNSGSTLSINAVAPPLTFSKQENYTFLGWDGTGSGSYVGPDASGLITMNGSINETATWKHEYYLTVTSLYGSPTPSTGWYDAGEPILLSVVLPTSEPTDTRNVCIGWNGTGTVPASGTSMPTNISITEPSSITWNWKTQYHIYVNTDPAGLSPQPNASSPGPWYDEGALVTFTAKNVSDKVFDHWIVNGARATSYERGLNPINITVYEPCTVTAQYLPVPAWWENLLGPQNIPFLLALLAVMFGSLSGGLWIWTRKRRVGTPHPEHVPTVPKVASLPDRIATGCEDLDNLLYGGIPEGYAVALTSPSCDERDLIIKGFLETGAKKGDATFYVTIDPGGLGSLAEEYRSNFFLFVCNPRADTMVESLPNVFKLKGVENLTETIIALNKAFNALEGQQSVQKRACIEIISDVLLQHHALQTRRWLTDLIPELRSKGFTTLAMVNLEMHPAQEVQAILDLFEGQISIFEKDTRTGPLRFVRVTKMTGQKYLDCELTLTKRGFGEQGGEAQPTR